MSFVITYSTTNLTGGMILNKFKKLIFNMFIVMMLSISITTFTDISPYSIAEAAVKAPSLKSEKKTLYSGYDTYTIEIKNLQNNSKVTYKSSNTKVATVSNKGVVKPLVKGTTTITATVKQISKTFNLKMSVTVQAPKVTLTQATDYLNIGDTFLFKATAEGMKDKVVWTISNSNIININSSGNITALTAGKATVYAKAGDKVSKQEITVGTNTLGTFTSNITLYEKTTIWVNSDNKDEKEILAADKYSSKVATYVLGDWSGTKVALTITPLSVGTDTITITSNSSEDRLILHITVIDKPVAKKLTSTELYAKCVPCTVEIGVTTEYGEALGSGFFIGNGRIVTNYHVIEGATKIIVTTSDKKKYEIKNILGYNATLDLAILELKIEHEYLNINQNIAGGEDIYAIGSPLGLSNTMTKGMVSTASRVIEDVEYIQIDASISPGNSGGPLVNEYGEVVGINTMYIEGGQNLNFAISIKELQKIYTNLPETVTEYQKRYVEYWEAWYLANLIYEDPTLSQTFKTSQEIYFGYGVKGTIKTSEKGDCYYIYVTEDCKLIGILESETLTDLKNTYFDLYSYSGEYIGGCKEDESKISQYMSQSIKAGEYIIRIVLPEDYVGADVNYEFVLYNYPE